MIYEGGGSATIGGPCESRGSAQVCDWSPAAGVRVDLGDGDDWGDVSDELPANARFTLSGGAGNDKLQADVQGSTLDGGPGNDTPLGAHGERGNARTLKFVVR